MPSAGRQNLLNTLRATSRRHIGLFEVWAASILLIWVVIAIACWSL